MLDANQRSALAIIRSLGRHGLHVIAADSQPDTLGAASRYAAGSVRYPDPAKSPESFISGVITIAAELGIETIIPATDLTTMLLVNPPDLPTSVRLAIPPASSYETLTDKASLLQLAGRLDVPIPETRIADSRAAIMTAARDIGFPVVLKPSRSRYLKNGRVFSTNVEIVRDPTGLCDVLRGVGWLSDIPCLVQRFVRGHGAGVFGLYAPSKEVAWFSHRRIREKPPTGGVSVLCESVPIDAAMRSAAANVLSAVGWVGAAMVEFRVSDDGTPFLMEVNGRFWGSLQLAIDCGIDFPWLLYRVTNDLPVTDPEPYSVGKRLRWLMGDLDSLIITLKRIESSPAGRVRAVTTFLRSFADPTCRQEIFRVSDPKPGFREVAHWMAAVRSSRHSG